VFSYVILSIINYYFHVVLFTVVLFIAVSYTVYETISRWCEQWLENEVCIVREH